MATPYLDSLILQVRHHPDIQDLYTSAGVAISSAGTSGVAHTVDEVTQAIIRATNAFLTAAWDAASQRESDPRKAGELMLSSFQEIEDRAELTVTGDSAQPFEIYGALPADYLAPLSVFLDFTGFAPSTFGTNPRRRVRFVSPYRAKVILETMCEEKGPAAYIAGGKLHVVYRGVTMWENSVGPKLYLDYLRTQKNITQNGGTDLMLGSRYDLKIVETAAQLLKSRS